MADEMPERSAAREEAPDLAALSEAGGGETTPPEELLALRKEYERAWRAILKPGPDDPRSEQIRWGVFRIARGDYQAALEELHRADHLLDLRSEVGRGLVALALMSALRSDKRPGFAPHINAALAFLAQEPTP